MPPTVPCHVMTVDAGPQKCPYPSTLQLPFKIHRIPQNGDHKGLDRGTLEVVGDGLHPKTKVPGSIMLSTLEVEAKSQQGGKGPKRPHKHRDPTNHGFWTPLVLGLRARTQDPCVYVGSNNHGHLIWTPHNRIPHRSTPKQDPQMEKCVAGAETSPQHLPGTQPPKPLRGAP